jgi:hypothetical protein
VRFIEKLLKEGGHRNRAMPEDEGENKEDKLVAEGKEETRRKSRCR